MTLLVRNNFFKGGILLAALSLGLTAAGTYFTFQTFPEAVASAAMRSWELIRPLTGDIAKTSDYVPLGSMLGAAVYSLIGIIFISHFFEKTQSPEILFFGFFVVSLSFEFARLMIPLQICYDLPAMYLISGSRLLLFGRFFGLFSLFAASVYAAGLDIQKQQNVLFSIIVATLLITLNVPIDSLVWDSTLIPISGYSAMFSLVEIGTVAVTIFTFMISAYIHNSRTYVFIALSIIMIYIGRKLVFNSDTWIFLFPGFIILAAATWFVCVLLRREYLWL